MSEASADLGDLSALSEGEMKVFPDVGDYGLVVCRVGGSLHALEDNCSHADTPLSEGRLRNGMITCPLHGAQFDVVTGEHQGPPAFTGVPCYPVSEDSGQAQVDLGGGEVAGAPDTDIGSRFETR